MRECENVHFMTVIGYNNSTQVQGFGFLEEDQAPYNTGNVAVDLSLKLALETISFCELLDRSGKTTISYQFLRSGTSVGANISEAQEAESRADFIHKIKIAAKETREVMYWATLCKHAESYPEPVAIIEIAINLNRILSKIIINSRSSKRQ